MKRVIMALCLVGTVVVCAQADPIEISNSNKTFTVSDRGKVVIGINPDGTVVNPWTAIYTKGAWAGDVQIVSHYVGTNNLGGGGFLAYHSNLDPVTSEETLPKKEDRLGYLLFGSRNNGSALNAAGIEAHAEGDWGVAPDGAKDLPTYLSFQTTGKPPYPTPANWPFTRTERMRITGDGNVGIGTGTEPLTQKLEINGGVRLIPQTATQSDCNESTRGTFWVAKDDVEGDSVIVCVKVKAASGEMLWKPVTLNNRVLQQ